MISILKKAMAKCEKKIDLEAKLADYGTWQITLKRKKITFTRGPQMMRIK